MPSSYPQRMADKWDAAPISPILPSAGRGKLWRPKASRRPTLSGWSGSTPRRCANATGDLAPADAEIVLEGYLDERGWNESEGPYGEFTFYLPGDMFGFETGDDHTFSAP